jgi:hypothetical protein
MRLVGATLTSSKLGARRPRATRSKMHDMAEGLAIDAELRHGGSTATTSSSVVLQY